MHSYQFQPELFFPDQQFNDGYGTYQEQYESFDRQQGLSVRLASLERQNERLVREVTRLNQVVERHTRRLNRLNQRLRAVENVLRIPFTATEDGF